MNETEECLHKQMEREEKANPFLKGRAHPELYFRERGIRQIVWRD